jgi:hypothetical protein
MLSNLRICETTDIESRANCNILIGKSVSKWLIVWKGLVDWTKILKRILSSTCRRESRDLAMGKAHWQDHPDQVSDYKPFPKKSELHRGCKYTAVCLRIHHSEYKSWKHVTSIQFKLIFITKNINMFLFIFVLFSLFPPFLYLPFFGIPAHIAFNIFQFAATVTFPVRTQNYYNNQKTAPLKRRKNLTKCLNTLWLKISTHTHS